jgi:5-methyltetrahydropteroyltriglutamate--homocysteine methyltransferase
MKRSTDRILTTHAGSLHRPPDLLEMVQARQAGTGFDAGAFDARLKAAVAEAVRLQVENGIDVVSDGEYSKVSFAMYVLDRIDGFGGDNPTPRGFGDREDFPEYAATLSAPVGSVRPWCDGPLLWKGDAALRTDIENLTSAAKAAGAAEAFMPSASLGIVEEINENRYYPDMKAYLYALADVMRVEYKAIADAGLVLQIDAPDAAMGKHTQFRHAPLEDYKRQMQLRVEALNHALQDVPPEQVRYHICWGNYEGPHTHDVELKDIVDVTLAVNAAAYSIEASNPRHAHEWRVWEDVKLPEGKVLIPGVIDTSTNFVEHPEVVAQRIEQYARLVGRENVIAGTDCGFGTSATGTRVHPTIAWAKLRSLADGARLASERLWAR